MRSTILVSALALAFASPAPRPLDATTRSYQRSVSLAIGRAQSALLNDVELSLEHTNWTDPWVVRSRFYEVRTTRSRYFGQAVGEGLDTMLGFFQEALRTDWVPTQPLPIFVMPDLDTYNDFGNNHGADHSSFYGSFYASGHPAQPVAAMYDAYLQRMQMTLTHSAAHQYIEQAFPRAQPPPWISEGLAKYFEWHWNFEAGFAEFRRISVDNNNWIPLRDLLSAPLPNYANATHNRMTELGALFTYLFTYREDTRTVWEDDTVVRAPFGDYLNALLSRRDVSRMPIHRLLTNGLAELESELRACSFD